MAVEWVRSCYSSEWQLFRDSDRRTKGRYYFCDDATPFYPGFHNLASREWNDANWTHDVRLGEVVDAKHTYYRGDPPAVGVIARAVGSRECLQHGETDANGVDAANLIEGFVPACMNDEAWARVSSYTNCTTRRVYASLIVQLYAFDDDGIHQTVADWIGDVLTPEEYSVVIRHHAGVMPGIISIVTAGWTVFILDGTSNFQEIALQAFAFAMPPQNFGIVGTAGLWYAASTYVLNHMQTDGMATDSRVMCVGHSYGGAAALVAAARLRHAAPERDIRYLTLGSPKIGNDHLVELVKRCRGWNLANTDDLITLLPPDALELLPILPLLAWPLMTNWGFWKRPPAQVFMDENGALFTRTAPLLDTQTLLSMAESAFRGDTISPIGGHRSAEYLRRIERQCPDAQWPINAPTSKLIWMPEAVLTMTAKRPPSRDGALVFTYAPIPVPGDSCADAGELPADTTYTGEVTGSVGDWWSVPFEAGVEYRIEIILLEGTLVSGQIYGGPNCGSASLQMSFGSSGGLSVAFFTPSVTQNYWLNIFRILGTSEYSLRWDIEP